MIVDVYADADTGQPTWLAIATGFFGTRIGVVPLTHAHRTSTGEVIVAYDRYTIETAPAVTITITINASDQQRLLDHYTTPPPPTPDTTHHHVEPAPPPPLRVVPPPDPDRP